MNEELDELVEQLAAYLAPTVTDNILQEYSKRSQQQYNTVLSDARCKFIHDTTAKESLNNDDTRLLLKAIGDMDDEHRFFEDGDSWDDSVMDKYAEYIKNYEYTYKPEATEIDPNIDPEELHIGPMAQDIEQVNPACIKETPEGVKTVDTARLAMMNAGVIADLARDVKDIKEQLNG